MRPPAEPQSALRAPLNYVLGTEVGVRILRVLSQTKTALGKSEVARRAALNASGVRRALENLLDLGILEPVGTGPRQAVRFRLEHPLAPALESLFDAERRRFESLIDDVRSKVQELEPRVMGAWIEGAVAREVDAPGDPVVIGILAPAPQVDLLAEQLFVALGEVMRRYDVLIEVRRRTKADLATASSGELDELSRAIPLVGPLPTPCDEARSDRPREEAYREEGTEVDRRLLNLAALIADRLARDPSLVEGARRYIARRLERASPAERRELLEWRQILSNTSLAQLRKFLVDPGERATRLRQTLPFVDVLSKEERDSVFLRADS